MRILRQSIFQGPNVYSLAPAVAAVVDPGPYRDRSPARCLPSLGTTLVQALPGLDRQRPSAPPAETFASGLAADTPGGWALLVARVAVELQRSLGFSVDYGARWSLRPTEEIAVFDLAHPGLGESVAGAALRIVQAAVDPPGPDDATPAMLVERWRRRHSGLPPSLMVRTMIDICRRRDIPWRHAHAGRRVLQLGHGHKLKRTVGNVAPSTSWIGGEIAKDKALTIRLLGEARLPVTEHRLVSSVEEGIRAARELGFPLVVKPNFSGQGRAVAPGLTSIVEVERALTAALVHGQSLVERHVDGDDHRIFVVDGRVVAVARKAPAAVRGDGVSTVGELVRRANDDPARGRNGAPLARIAFDDEARRVLAGQGLTEESIAPDGVRVLLRLNANLSTGGSAEDVAAQTHPDNIAMAERAARIVDLDIVGIDFLTPDISRSYREVGGAICEVNGTPGVRLHADGYAPRVVIERIVEKMFPNGDDGRIPIATITGSDGKTTTCHMVATILAAAGHRVGLATTVGTRIDGIAIDDEVGAGVTGARAVLGAPEVTAAVLESAHLGIMLRGLGFDRCDVGAMMNVRGDHVGVDRIRSIEHLAWVKGLVLAVARRLAVINADDPLCVAQRGRARQTPICWVTRNPDNPAVRRHAAAGLPAVVLEGRPDHSRIVLWSEGRAVPVIDPRTIPATHRGTAGFNVDNALFAVAVAHGMGIAAETIAGALAGYATERHGPAGRLESAPEAPFRLFMDFAHNAAEVAALARFASAQSVAGRRMIVLKSPGNRLESHFDGIAAAAAGHFDHYICSADPGTERNRPNGEIQRRLAQGLAAAGVPADRITRVRDEADALRSIVALARPDDLVIFCCNDVAAQRRALSGLVGTAATPLAGSETVSSPTRSR
ncbi:MAG: Mur ligase family protein [Alphaproteobacteria bacterium]